MPLPAHAAAGRCSGSTFWLAQPACAGLPMLRRAEFPTSPSDAAAALLRVPQHPAWVGLALALFHRKSWNQSVAQQAFRFLAIGLRAPRMILESPSRSVRWSNRRKPATALIDRSVRPPKP